MRDLALFINGFVLVYFLALDLTYTGLLMLSFWESGRHMRRVGFGGYETIFRSPLTLPISILVPAYNEETTIVETVNAMRLMEYGEFEIIVIDDGSTDSTLATMIDAFHMVPVDKPMRLSVKSQTVKRLYVSRQVPNLSLITKLNGGKADALNAGINTCRYPLFCSIDADAILERDALLRVVKPFMDRPRETVASCGIVRVVNGCKVRSGRVVSIAVPSNPLAMMQSVEYLRAFLATRTGWGKIGALFIISGAFGVFKKQAVVDVGGYRTDTVGEDMDLVIRLHRLMKQRREKYRITFIPDPVVWTEVPETIRVLYRQRNRWHRGLLECLTNNRSMMGDPRAGTMGLLAMPYNLIFEVGGPLIEATGYIALVISVVFGLLSVHFLLLYFLLAFAYGVFLSVSAVFLEELRLKHYHHTRDIRKLLLYTIAENFGYRQMQAFWRVWATRDFLMKKEGWGKMERKGYDTV